VERQVVREADEQMLPARLDRGDARTGEALGDAVAGEARMRHGTSSATPTNGRRRRATISRVSPSGMGT
jgi:hypothetical protein